MLKKRTGKVDLHLHSNKSDGLLSPTELVYLVAAAGLAAMALTDHDTIEGLEEASAASQGCDLEFVPGIEISVVEELRETHIIGYYPRNLPFLNEQLGALRKQRYLRMEETVQALNKMGFKIKYEEVLAEAGKAAPGRMHLARLLLKKKYIKTVDDAFRVYLGFSKPAYIARKTLNYEETMNLFNNSAAVPVLAHPGKEGIKVLPRLIRLGLKGIEVFHPDHSHEQVKLFSKIAIDNHLLITGGSDYHGIKGVGEGYPAELAIDYCYFNDLRLAAQ